MEVDKKQLVDTAIEMLRETRADIVESYEAQKEISINSPSRMQSRYDTMRSESAWLADSLANRALDLEAQIKALQGLDVANTNGHVKPGSVVSLEYIDSDEMKHYFIIPGGLGKKIPYNGLEIITISPVAPIAKAMIGKELYEEVTLRQKGELKTYEIMEIN
jgi:transcription elongation GreA/GreB family factor